MAGTFPLPLALRPEDPVLGVGGRPQISWGRRPLRAVTSSSCRTAPAPAARKSRAQSFNAGFKKEGLAPHHCAIGVPATIYVGPTEVPWTGIFEMRNNSNTLCHNERRSRIDKRAFRLDLATLNQPVSTP